MNYTWLGQAGFLLEAENGATLMIDPYLSNKLEEIKGTTFHRLVPIDGRFLRTPDILVLTHCHDDHTDLATLDILFEKQKRMYVLAPESVVPMLRERYGAAAEYIVFRSGTRVSLHGFVLDACPAVHSDPCAIGLSVYADGRTIYHMGDTLYHPSLIEKAPKNIDLLILPINGKGNNMNFLDAANMAKKLCPCAVLPMHWDMFSAYGSNPNEFAAEFSDVEGIEVIMPSHYQLCHL